MRINKVGIIFILLIIISSFSVFAGDIGFWDDYTVAASTDDDAITWRLVDMITYLTNYPGGTMVACWDWDGDGTISHCFAGPQSDMDACRAVSSSLDNLCLEGKCFKNDYDLGRKHWMNVSVSVGHEMKAKYFVDCGLPTYDVVYPTPISYYILKNRWYICDSEGGTYTDAGDFNHPLYLLAIQRDISCSSNYGCDLTKDHQNSGFGGSGDDIPSAPCSGEDGQSCSDNNDCFNECNACDVCVSDFDNDGCCETDEWDSYDSCNPCSSNQCVSYPWKECHNNNDLCCAGDGPDGNSDTVYGQYYCKTNEQWALCTYGYHNLGEKHEDYYCTYQDGTYAWRECYDGYNDATSTCYTPTIEADISVSPIYWNFTVGYGN